MHARGGVWTGAKTGASPQTRPGRRETASPRDALARKTCCRHRPAMRSRHGVRHYRPAHHRRRRGGGITHSRTETVQQTSYNNQQQAREESVLPTRRFRDPERQSRQREYNGSDNEKRQPSLLTTLRTSATLRDPRVKAFRSRYDNSVLPNHDPAMQSL
ncbi:hypothetical protein MRX96_028149 [Rhipicephalus microplus]